MIPDMMVFFLDINLSEIYPEANENPYRIEKNAPTRTNDCSAPKSNFLAISVIIMPLIPHAVKDVENVNKTILRKTNDC